MLGAAVAVLDAELPGESGWLTCDKLTAEQPLVKVVLVSRDAGARNQLLAAFVGAEALVRYEDGPAPLLADVCRPLLPAVG
jgi:CheY-like chemotaxis protein